MTVSILSERRALQPFGLEGGGPALSGLNVLQRTDGRCVNLGAKATVQLQSGERLRLLTPGKHECFALLCACASCDCSWLGQHLRCALELHPHAVRGAGGGGFGSNDDPSEGPAAKRRKLDVHELKGSLQTYKQNQESV